MATISRHCPSVYLGKPLKTMKNFSKDSLAKFQTKYLKIINMECYTCVEMPVLTSTCYLGYC